MSEDYAGGDPDFSEMLDDELAEIVNSNYGRYRPEVVEGAKNELGRRAARAQNEASPPKVTALRCCVTINSRRAKPGCPPRPPAFRAANFSPSGR